jgi:pimeloyl-ACP methyl ester carboxylesterase
MAATYSEAPNQLVSAANGVDFAYRRTGGGPVPLVLFQHFRGNLDNWDPALVDPLAAHRPVITFDNAGVGGSSGTTPDTIGAMARDALAFLDALDIAQADLLGFSIGSFVAQEIALIRPAVVRRLILASSAPQGAAGMHGWAPEVIGAVGVPEPGPDAYLGVFFTGSAASHQAGQQVLGRLTARTTDRDQATTWATRLAQYDAVCTWGIPGHSLLQRVAAIEAPVFIANGDHDPMILPRYSHLLAGLIRSPSSSSTPTPPTASCSSTTRSSPPTSSPSSLPSPGPGPPTPRPSPLDHPGPQIPQRTEPDHQYSPTPRPPLLPIPTSAKAAPPRNSSSPFTPTASPTPAKPALKTTIPPSQPHQARPPRPHQDPLWGSEVSRIRW